MVELCVNIKAFGKKVKGVVEEYPYTHNHIDVFLRENVEPSHLGAWVGARSGTLDETICEVAYLSLMKETRYE